jgi:hypothetical protein
MANGFGAIAAQALRTTAGRSDSRSKMIYAVRAACGRLGIDDDDRRAIQIEETGKASLADMDVSDLGKLLDRLNKGWKGPMGHRAYIGKIRALWWTLYWLGAVEDPKDAPLEAFIKRQTGKSRLPFLGHKEAFSVIEALKSWAAREGVEWPGEQQLADRRRTDPRVELPQLDRHAVLDAIAQKLRRLGALGFGYASYCEKALKLACNHLTWTDRELDACIRLLGKRLRRELGKREAVDG